jgi:hypothetical protein
VTDQDYSPDRRDVIKTAGLGLGMGVGMGVGMGLGLLPAARAEGTAGAVWSSEYWAKKATNEAAGKGTVELNLWRKRLGAPQAGEAPRPVLFMVHGSSNSCRTSYDLAVPGKAASSRCRTLS